MSTVCYSDMCPYPGELSCPRCDEPFFQDGETVFHGLPIKIFVAGCICEVSQSWYLDLCYEDAMRAAGTERLPWEYPPER